MKYLVNSHVYVSALVEAKSTEEAEKIAKEKLSEFATKSTAETKGIDVQQPTYVNAVKVPAGTDVIN